MKKSILFGLGGLVVLGMVWNSTGVKTCFLKMRQRHEEKQRTELVENWEVHFDAELAKMQEADRELGRKIYKQKVKAEKTRIEVESLRGKEVEYDRLVRSFVDRMKEEQNVAGGPTHIAFAGRRFTPDEAEVQLISYLGELKSLRARIAHLDELHAAQASVIDGYVDARKKLNGRIAEMKIKREQYALEQDLLAVRTEIQRTRDLASEIEDNKVEGRDDGRLESLLEVMDDAILEKKAELSVTAEIDAEGSPSPMSLSETSSRFEKDAEADEVEALRREYWERAGSE